MALVLFQLKGENEELRRLLEVATADSEARAREAESFRCLEQDYLDQVRLLETRLKDERTRSEKEKQAIEDHWKSKLVSF